MTIEDITNKDKVLNYWDAIVNLMDDDKRESCHLSGDYDDEITFLIDYVNHYDAGFYDVLKTEFHVVKD